MFQPERMSETEILGQARECASEFVVTAKPVYFNGEHAIKYDIKISENALYRMSNRTPGTKELTLPFCGNPKHFIYKLNDQVKITCFQVTNAIRPRMYVPDPIERPVGTLVSQAVSIPLLFPCSPRPIRPLNPMTYSRNATNDPRRIHLDERRDSQEGQQQQLQPGTHCPC